MAAGSKAVMAAKDDVPVRWGSQGHLPCWMGWPRGGSTGPTCLRASGLLFSLCEDRSSVGASHLGTLSPWHSSTWGPFMWVGPLYLGIFSPGHPSPGPTLALNLNSPGPMGTILCLLKLRFLLCKVGLMLPFDSVRKIHPTPFQGARCP